MTKSGSSTEWSSEGNVNPGMRAGETQADYDARMQQEAAQASLSVDDYKAQLSQAEQSGGNR